MSIGKVVSAVVDGVSNALSVMQMTGGETPLDPRCLAVFGIGLGATFWDIYRDHKQGRKLDEVSGLLKDEIDHRLKALEAGGQLAADQVARWEDLDVADL